MTAPTPPPAPRGVLASLVPFLQVSAFVLWIVELLAVGGLVAATPAFTMMLAEMGCRPLPAVTVLVLNAHAVARSWLGLAALVALLVGSVIGYWKARDSYTYWGVLTVLKLAAIFWLALAVLALFLPLIEGPIKTIR